MLLEFLNYLLPKKYKETTATTSLKHLSPFVLKNLEILIPDQKILEKFNNFWKNIHFKIEKLEQKIEKYEKIKKNLLSDLFSQKITVI
ncbi:restriction endonuclease subunit S [Mycoplasma parvum]|uniref:Type I restriction modification DNA specificity domain-containing protein n=1 Tax=Mycoplasma parvum str. Indiana TaxID=1403316 RepID=U5NBL4_9MOLU|nr:hypothetical protein [Mycoplasma parvum]AGX88941.1 hypothetical protein PRV_00880 [Mycoplasma parvum str. Indiana]